MLRFTKPAALTAAAALAVGLTTTLTAQAAPTTAPECVRAGLVWVSVEYDSFVTGGCADEFTTASAALQSAGLVTGAEPFVTVVDGRTANAADREWWSVYSKGAGEDGTYPAGWDFAQVGVMELRLAPSDVLAMVLQPDWNVMAAPPVTDPVAGIDLDDPTEPEPSTGPSTEPTTDPTPQPTTDPTPQPTTDPTPQPTTDPTPQPTTDPTPQPTTDPTHGRAPPPAHRGAGPAPRPGLPNSGN
ncbi:hypothetical protein G7085_17915 [Tessaracoccus sp. HDW20]|uniref:hypothetical protein n=1 Tax=Tessaracoccus coleopterorum TaxID=2714950 RepID=UPI0018D44687|nr:hypothetical protein [Tessaracoccus coleopterorum]NHB85808.1 hypothetical protein [Tessaracoccus coleopterorum]